MTEYLPAIQFPEDMKKKDRLIQVLFTYPEYSQLQQGIMAGYPEDSAGSIVSKYLRHDEKFKQAVKEYALSNDVKSLSIISTIEDKALDIVINTKDDDEFLDRRNKIKDLTKQKKQTTGILANEDDKRSVTINVKEIGSIMLNNLKQDNEAIDADFHEVK